MNSTLSQPPPAPDAGHCPSLRDDPAGIVTGPAAVALSFGIPRDDFAEFGRDVPPEERRSVELKLRLLGRIHERKRTKKQSVQSSCTEIAAVYNRRGLTAKRLKDLYYAYAASGDWRALVNKAKAPALSARELGSQLPAEFRRWWGEFSMTNQRQVVLERMRALNDRLRMWRMTGQKQFAIPGYETPPANASGSDRPAGWHPSTLYRHAADAFERAAFAIGRQEARNFAPQVNTTRAKLLAGQHVAFDDQVHDIKVNFERNRIIQRPLEFVCLDRFSGCFIGHYFKPVIWDDYNEKRITLNKVDFVWFAVSWFLGTGYRADTGTTIFAEHGTAKFPDFLKEAMVRISGDRVSFVEGGVDRRAAFDGMYPGPARGNFRVKSWLESIFNLVRNEMADMAQFPGQVGKDRLNSPEEEQAANAAIQEGRQAGLLTRQRMNEQLTLAGLVLAKNDKLVEQMRRPYLDWHTFVNLAMRAYDRIDGRIDHKLEGWVEAGLMTQDYRLEARADDPDGGWLPVDRLQAMAPEQRTAIQAFIEADSLNRLRPRRMSPREALQSQIADLTRPDPAEALPLLIPPEPPFAFERTVNERGLIEFEDANIRPGKLRFHAVARGDHKRSGQKFMTMISPVNPTALHLFDARGRYLGACPEWAAEDAADLAAIHRKQGKVERELARKLEPVARAGAGIAKQRAEDTAHNLALLDGKIQEEDDLAALASDAFMANEQTEPQPQEKHD